MNIAGALSAGFTVKQILNYLGDAFPELAPRIKDVIKSGKPAEDILKYLSKVDKNHLKKFSKGKKPEKLYPEEGSQNPFIAASQFQEQLDPTPELVKTGAKLGLGALAGYGASRALPAIVKGVRGVVGGSANKELPTNVIEQASKAPAPLSREGITRQASAMSPVFDPEFEQFVKDKMAFEPNAPMQPLEDLKKEFDLSKKSLSQKNERVRSGLSNDFITPSGDIGAIKSERNGKALVDVNGKIEQFSRKDLEKPPEDLFTAVEHLLDLPEQEKSSVISSLIYRPAKKELFIKYHNGDSYVYEDITEDEMGPVVEALGVPVSSGGNVYGAWEKGKQDSRGAALVTNILRNPKYGKEHQGKTWEKLETKYDRYKKLYKVKKR